VRGARLPGIYGLFVLLTAGQVGLFVLTGVASHISTRGLWFIAALLVGLAFRSRLAWLVLVLMNGLPLVAIPLGVGNASVLWGNVTLIVVTGVALGGDAALAVDASHVWERSASYREHPALQ
jgi:hypothetical protein